MSELDVRLLGRVPYEDAVRRQLDAVDRRVRDEIPDRLLLLEHDDVYTLGRRGERSHLPARPSAPVVECARGGDVTWHGPGQLVGYWIRRLEGCERDLHRHLRLIEGALIAALSTWGVTGERREGLTGVWVDGAKVASIGVGVRRWVTWHGFALNVDVDLGVYAGFSPCGLQGSVMTDLASLVDPPPDLAAAADAVARAFRGLSVDGPAAIP
jgi:lipoate-protein ligase B